MSTIIRMPAVLASATEAAIQSWSVVEGQTIHVGDPLADIETEKAVVEYAAEVDGTVGRLIAQPGDNIQVGEPIAIILDAGEDASQLETISLDSPSAPDAIHEPPAVAPVPAEAPSPDRAAIRVFASPIVRKLAADRGVDLGAVEGTGPGGRIVRRDLERVERRTSDTAAAVTTATSGPGFVDIPLTGMRRAIARRLTESKTTVPHFYLTAHVRVDHLIALRAEVNETAPRRVSLNDFIVKAVAGALVEVPAANAIWGGDHLRSFETVDLAIAVAVDGGLLTPVLRGVESRGLLSISAGIADLADRARAGRLRQDELEGGSFSISNLGMYGVDEFSAILNPPQAGILAVSAAKQRAIVVDGELMVGTMLTVTLSADHRVIDGAIAAEWMSCFTRLVEHPVSLLL